MNIKKNFQTFFLISVILIMVLVSVGTIYFSKITQQQQKKNNPVKAEESSRPEYQPNDNKTDPNQWAEFIHPDFHYQIRYPQEFQVERRGKMGNIEDLVAINYSDGNKRLTIVKIQITNEISETSNNQKGKDNNGNEVIVFKKPLNNSKTITMIGTIYPNTGSNYRFEEVIQKIIESLK